MADTYRFLQLQGSDSGMRNSVIKLDDGAELTAFNAAFVAGDEFHSITSSTTVVNFRHVAGIHPATLADFDAWKIRWNRRDVYSTDGRIEERVRMFAVEMALAIQNEYTVADDLYGARATNLFIVNENNQGQTATFELVPDGGTPGAGINFLFELPLAGNESVQLSGDLFMEPGDSIALEGSAAGVWAVMSGWEIS